MKTGDLGIDPAVWGGSGPRSDSLVPVFFFPRLPTLFAVGSDAEHHHELLVRCHCKDIEDITVLSMCGRFDVER